MREHVGWMGGWGGMGPSGVAACESDCAPGCLLMLPVREITNKQTASPAACAAHAAFVPQTTAWHGWLCGYLWIEVCAVSWTAEDPLAYVREGRRFGQALDLSHTLQQWMMSGIAPLPQGL